MGNGLIFAFVVALWAAYFVPLAVRRYDEASKSDSIERFSSLSRVIKAKVRRHDATEVAPAGAAEPVAAEAADADESAASGVDATVPAGDSAGPAPADDAADAAAPAPAAQTSGQRRPVNRRAARLAAKRRRRTLLTLLGITIVVTGLAVSSVIPLWLIAVPLVLVASWLVACRIQVRGELGIELPAIRRPGTRLPSIRLPKFDVVGWYKDFTASPEQFDVEAEQTVILSGQFEDVEPHRKRVMEKAELEAGALDEQLVIAVPVGTTNGEATWDPLPVTLPTYVTKPRAGRTVRTIDFAEPGTWTSGHIEGEDVELPKRDDDSGEHRRAVGH